MAQLESYFDKSESRLDDIKYVGFDYKGQIFNKTISKLVLNEMKRYKILQKLEETIYMCIEHVKSIKRNVNFHMKKNYTKFN